MSDDEIKKYLLLFFFGRHVAMLALDDRALLSYHFLHVLQPLEEPAYLQSAEREKERERERERKREEESGEVAGRRKWMEGSVCPLLSLSFSLSWST